MENSDWIYTEDFDDTRSIDGDNLDLIDNDTESELDETAFNEPEATGRVIDVNNDFGGDLAAAIAAANDGDTVQLGNNIYYTEGIVIDRNITLSGAEASIVDGNGAATSVFHLTPQASGTTIQDIAITNGNNGIYGNGATNLTLQNLDIDRIGISETVRHGENNTGIMLNRADGVRILDSQISNVGKKGVGIGDTDGATVSGLVVQNVNLEAQHAQSHGAAGVKFFNTNNATLSDSYFANINANNIWNDTTSNTTIVDNVIDNVGDRFIKPSFNTNVDISGIYNEKSVYSIVESNDVSSLEEFSALNATAFSTETMALDENNFSSFELNTTDYWANEQIERLIATTENPSEANFDLFAQDYYQQANIG